MSERPNIGFFLFFLFLRVVRGPQKWAGRPGVGDLRDHRASNPDEQETVRGPNRSGCYLIVPNGRVPYPLGFYGQVDETGPQSTYENAG